jgi:hypothetical protein
VSEPEPQLVTVYLVNGVRTSVGSGPGVLRLPPAEASALVGARLAIYGDRPPNVPEPEPVRRPFPHVPSRRAASSN